LDIRPRSLHRSKRQCIAFGAALVGLTARAVPGREIVLLAALIAACIAVALGSLVFELE
jgi:hypothetical protein